MDSRIGFMVCKTDIGHVMCDVSKGPIVDFRYYIVYCMEGDVHTAISNLVSHDINFIH